MRLCASSPSPGGRGFNVQPREPERNEANERASRCAGTFGVAIRPIVDGSRRAVAQGAARMSSAMRYLVPAAAFSSTPPTNTGPAVSAAMILRATIPGRGYSFTSFSDAS